MKRQMTNVELVTHLLEHSKHGALMQIVLMEGFRTYCAAIVQAPDGFLGDAANMFDERTWRATCQEYLDALDNREAFTVDEREPELEGDDDGSPNYFERLALLHLLLQLRTRGWQVSYVNDGEEDLEAEGKALAQVVEDAAAAELAWIHFKRPGEAPNEDTTGAAMVVWGNSPIELIADFTTGNDFEAAMDAALKALWPNYPEE